MFDPAPTGFIARLLAVVDRLLGAICDTLPAPDAAIDTIDATAALVAMTAWHWLWRTTERLVGLVNAIETGTLKPLAPRRGSRPPSLRDSGYVALPRRFGWLAAIVPAPQPLTADMGGLLIDADLAPMLAQEPGRFGRLLRPLCRALGLAPPEPLRDPAPTAAAPPTPPPAPTQPAAQRPPSPGRPFRRAGYSRFLHGRRLRVPKKA